MKRLCPSNLLVTALLASCIAPASTSEAQELPLVMNVEFQPLSAQAVRVAQALELLGVPLTEHQQAELQAALESTIPADGIKRIQQVFDPLCLVGVNINPESRVKAQPGAASKQLMQQGWRVFLVKVHNEAGVTARLRCDSPNASKMHDSKNDPEPLQKITPRELSRRWLDVSMYDGAPMVERLSGLEVEYRIVELFSRDMGKREARLVFDVGQGTQDLGFRNAVNLLFNCEPCVEVRIDVLDHDGTPTTGKFIFRDQQGRVYPARARRLAPDFFFHDQVYRSHGDTVLLPAGNYTVDYTRGPEYQLLQREIVVPPGPTHSERFRLKRWINLARAGWHSGDHHLHAAGCSHYSSPTKGVDPSDMMLHILGEDLNVGCVLTWGPCWYHQKQFFEGDEHDLSTPRYVMRYDVEVSGFPSSHAGHLVLLRLKEDDYPGTTRIEEWPSWDLPILQWAKEQGGVVGFAHSGWGLEVKEEVLPNYEVPQFDGIGANEYIVDVTHNACDFISAVDTPVIWELSAWYHTLNCGFTTRISGETDFPCIYGERVGLGRIYVKMPSGVPLDFDSWVQGLKDGRSYCCDGLTHLFDYQIDNLGVGEPGDAGRPSVLAVSSGQPLKARVLAAALLEEVPDEEIRGRNLKQKPYWHVERARFEDSRQVSVELVVNGQAVDSQLIEADGRVQDVEFDFTPERSSWVALRIFPAAHTNPIFVEVDGQPIIASKRSAQWCLDSVDACWESKSPQIRDEEREEARAAYDHAREVYRTILSKAYDDRQSAKE